jgi:hypothetical protein
MDRHSAFIDLANLKYHRFLLAALLIFVQTANQSDILGRLP